MVWCEFWEAKENPHYYYIEAPFSEACKILKERTGLDMNGIGGNYIHHDEWKTYCIATGYNRNLKSIVVPKVDGLYQNNDEQVLLHTWLEEDEYTPCGYFYKRSDRGAPQSIEEFEARPDVTVWRKEEC